MKHERRRFVPGIGYSLDAKLKRKGYAESLGKRNSLYWFKKTRYGLILITWYAETYTTRVKRIRESLIPKNIPTPVSELWMIRAFQHEFMDSI
jgi:hypothetical protein